MSKYCSLIGDFMKYFALAATAALSLVAIAAPANAAGFRWDVEYTGWWEADGGGSVAGTFSAGEDAASDGIVSPDEIKFWSWNWSGNDAVSAFTISSKDENAEIQVVDPSLANGFYVDGTPNQPNLLDNLDQAVFAAGNYLLDLEFLYVQDFATDGFSGGDSEAASGTVSVSEPIPVPEPTTVLGLLALAGTAIATLKRQKQNA